MLRRAIGNIHVENLNVERMIFRRNIKFWVKNDKLHLDSSGISVTFSIW